MNRSDALADAVEAWAREQLKPSTYGQKKLFDALAAYRSTAPKGELVRLACYRDDHGGLRGFYPYKPVECDPPDFYVTFPMPPAREVPVVTGEVE